MTTIVLTEAEVKGEARRIGFVACGITSLEPNEHADVFDRWLAAGYAGTMRYLHRQAAKRREPSLATPGARCAVVVLENYAAPDDKRLRSGDAFKVASYARGTDYHIVTQARLRRLADWLLEHGATIAHPRVDAGPVPERELAHRAGLGWIGKNGMLIHPTIGSFTFVGTVFTDLKLASDTAVVSDHCGSCTRCLDACPTDAFVAPSVLDATRCLSYLTIEHRPDPPVELTEHWDGWAFGCDVCNDVCPWNIKFATPTAVPEFARRELPDRSDPAAFDRLTEAQFDESYADTPFMRPGLERMRRNVRLATARHATSTLTDS